MWSSHEKKERCLRVINFFKKRTIKKNGKKEGGREGGGWNGVGGCVCFEINLWVIPVCGIFPKVRVGWFHVLVLYVIRGVVS